MQINQMLKAACGCCTLFLCLALAAVEARGDQSADQATASAPNDGTPMLLAAREPQRFGWIEPVILSPELGWKLDAKLDTGADTSSLDALDIKRVRYKGNSYVRFSVRNPETGEMVSLRRPYVRTVRIRRHSGNHQRRRVVLMTVCLGDAERTIEVTLTDREQFDYAMLLGRSALAGMALVDPDATHTSQPQCQDAFGKADEGAPADEGGAATGADSASDQDRGRQAAPAGEPTGDLTSPPSAAPTDEPAGDSTSPPSATPRGDDAPTSTDSADRAAPSDSATAVTSDEPDYRKTPDRESSAPDPAPDSDADGVRDHG